jgi:adenylyltransferase/sulfurtransferase
MTPNGLAHMSDTSPEEKQLLDFAEDRYATLKLIDWFDIDDIQKAKFLVVGAGAVGNEVLKNLALLGIGNLFIYDRDIIEMSNLTRSILFSAGDNGHPKAQIAARAVKVINPDIRVQWQNGDVRWDLGIGLIRRMDVVIGCLDNSEARLNINSKCYSAGRPWVDAGIGTLNGQVRVFRPPLGACYECTFTDDDYAQMAMPCNRLASMYAVEGKIPTMPTIASIVAGVQVQEALKLLSYDDWHGRTLVGRQFSYNGSVEDVSIAQLPRREGCPNHRPPETRRFIELPTAMASQTTFGELVQAIENHLGAGSTLLLNFDLALSVSCAGCRRVKQLLRPLGKVFLEDLVCPRCGREGMLDPVRDVTTSINRVHPHYGVLQKMPLAAVSVPPLDILTGVGTCGSEAYFELTGDRENLLGTFDI